MSAGHGTSQSSDHPPFSIFTSLTAVATYRALFASQQFRPVKLLAWTGIVIVLTLRCIRQFNREVLLLAAAFVAACATMGVLPVCCGVLGIGGPWLLVYLNKQPQMNRGHRMGAEGYTGELSENTLEALRTLISMDNNADTGPLDGFPYVETDIHETKDGELVMIHDSHVQRSFPLTGLNVTAVASLEQQGITYATVKIKDLSSAQLRTLHLGGRAGLHVPTLQECLDTCQQCKLRRPLVLEVKNLISDAGRRRFLQCIRGYRPTAQRMAADYPQFSYHPFGHLGVIAFPHLFAASFGEFGSKQWRQWAVQLRELVLVRSCCCHALSLVYVRGAGSGDKELVQ